MAGLFWEQNARVRSILAWSNLSNASWYIPSMIQDTDEYIKRIRKNLADAKKWIATEAGITQWVLAWSYTKAWVPIQAAAATIADANKSTAVRIAEQQWLADQKELAAKQASDQSVLSAAQLEDQIRQNAYQIQEQQKANEQELANYATYYKAPWIKSPTESYQSFIKRVLSGNT